MLCVADALECPSSLRHWLLVLLTLHCASILAMHVAMQEATMEVSFDM